MGLDINWAIITPLIVIQLILTVIALIDLFKSDTTRGPKSMWVFIIVFIATLGPIVYFIAGRRDM